MPRQKYIPAKFFGAGFMDKPVRNPKAHINIYIYRDQSCGVETTATKSPTKTHQGLSKPKNLFSKLL